MQGLSHDKDLLATEGFLCVRGPSIELVCGVWKQNTVIFCFGLLNYLKELRGNLRCGRDTFIGWTSKDQEDVLTFFNHYLLLVIAFSTTGQHLRENAFVISLSAAIKDADNVAVVFFAHSSESTF